ncbi:MAG: peptidoglycan-binding protein [Rhodospirillales bacterium]|nr:peptidoglycan-binding protein [Rhodospirillales bacterium]
MFSHAPLKGLQAGRPRLALGAAAVACLLLTAACTLDGTKNVACSAAAGIDNLFGTTSSGRAEDCGGTAGQSARANTGAKQAARPAGPRVDRASLSDLQARLRDLGYDPGPADGQMGPKTRAAIRAYQKDEGLKADGQVTASLLERIKAE